MCASKIASTLDDEVVRQLLDACGDVKSWKQARDPETRALHSDVHHRLPVPTPPLTAHDASLGALRASSQNSSRRRQQQAPRQPRQGELGQQQQQQQLSAKGGPRSTSAWHQESLDERIERKLRG